MVHVGSVLFHVVAGVLQLLGELLINELIIEIVIVTSIGLIKELCEANESIESFRQSK